MSVHLFGGHCREAVCISSRCHLKVIPVIKASQVIPGLPNHPIHPQSSSARCSPWQLAHGTCCAHTHKRPGRDGRLLSLSLSHGG